MQGRVHHVAELPAAITTPLEHGPAIQKAQVCGMVIDFFAVRPCGRVTGGEDIYMLTFATDHHQSHPDLCLCKHEYSFRR